MKYSPVCQVVDPILTEAGLNPVLHHMHKFMGQALLQVGLGPGLQEIQIHDHNPHRVQLGRKAIDRSHTSGPVGRQGAGKVQPSRSTGAVTIS